MANVRGDEVMQRLRMISPARDFLVVEKVNANAWRDAGRILPAPGDLHPNQARFRGWKVCGITPGDEAGWQEVFYLKPLEDQQAYNWEYANTLGNEYDEVELTYLIPRADYAPGSLGAPPSLGGRTWTYMGERQVRSDAETDAFYVRVVQSFMDISTARSGVRVDGETGELRPFSRQIVAAGTAGQAVDSSGTYAEVRPVNRLFSIKETMQAAGLAGAGDGATRTWDDVINYPWPDVLAGFDFYALPDADGQIAKIAQRPIWLREAYNGPCEAEITETWTLAEPTPPALVPMLEGEVWFDGALLSVPRLRCLHPELTFYEAPGSSHPTLGNYLYSQTFEATTLEDWPAEHVASFTVRPAFGGYLSRKVVVKRPSVAGLFQNVILLKAGVPSGVNGFTFSWERVNPVGTLTRYRMDVNTKPDFTGTFLTGWKNKNLNTATTETVTGLTAGVVYYVRVKAELVVSEADVTVNSNTVLVAAEPVVAYTLTVVETSQVVADGDEIDFGAFVLGDSPEVLTLRITNTGNVALLGLARALTGADAADWTAASLSSASLAVAATRDFTLTLDPALAGTKAAVLTLSSTNGPDLVADLAAQVTDAILLLESPDNTPLTSGGSTLNFSSDGVTPDDKTVVLRGNGTTPVTVTALNLTLTDAARWSIVGGPTLPLVLDPAEEVSFTLRFLSNGGGPYSAALEAVSDDPDSPFIVFLQGADI
jgi:hypothetical protein